MTGWATAGSADNNACANPNAATVRQALCSQMSIESPLSAFACQLLGESRIDLRQTNVVREGRANMRFMGTDDINPNIAGADMNMRDRRKMRLSLHD